jgi:hypothetical protein
MKKDEDFEDSIEFLDFPIITSFLLHYLFSLSKYKSH